MRAGSLHFVNPTFIWHKHGHVMPRLSGQLRDEVRNFFLLRTQVQDEKNNWYETIIIKHIKMPDYAQGKIYNISSESGEKIYVGSTTCF